jgi:hypothetical protein
LGTGEQVAEFKTGSWDGGRESGGFSQAPNLLLAQERASHPRAMQAGQPIRRWDLAGLGRLVPKAGVRSRQNHAIARRHPTLPCIPPLCGRPTPDNCPVSFRVCEVHTRPATMLVEFASWALQRPILSVATLVYCVLYLLRSPRIPRFSISQWPSFPGRALCICHVHEH